MASTSILHAALLSFVICGSATAQTPVDAGSMDDEVQTSTGTAERQGFTMLEENGRQDTRQAKMIRDNLLPEIEKGLPEPSPGFSYSLADIDGDGGPELFLKIRHWTICEPGCPVRIYRFDPKDQAWKMFFEVNASLIGLKTANVAAPEMVVLSDGPQGRGPTTSAYYRFKDWKFIKIKPAKPKGETAKPKKKVPSGR